MSDSVMPPAADPAQSPQSSRPKTSGKALMFALAGVLAVGVVVAVVVAVIQPSTITRTAEACSGTKPLDDFFDELRADETPPPGASGPDASSEFDDLFVDLVSVEDEGTTLIVNTKPIGDDPLGISRLALECVYEQLDVPDHLIERISQTRALDGRQSGEWGDYTASWSYHPDSGANVIIVQN